MNRFLRFTKRWKFTITALLFVATMSMLILMRFGWEYMAVFLLGFATVMMVYR